MQKHITGQNRLEGDQEGICGESVVLCHKLVVGQLRLSTEQTE